MKKTIFSLGHAIILITILSAPVAVSQDVKTDTLLEKNVIPLSDVATEITKLNSLLLGKQTLLLTEEGRSEIKQSVDTLRFRLSLLREDPRIQNVLSLNLRSLSNLRNDWSILNSRLLNKQSDLTLKLQKLDNEQAILNSNEELWNNTLTLAAESESAEILVVQIEESIGHIKDLNQLLQSNIEFIQENLVNISEAVIYCNNILVSLNEAASLSGKQFLKLNQEPIWNIIFRKSTKPVFSAERSWADDAKFYFRDFVSENEFKLILQLIFGIIIFLLAIYLFRNLQSTIPKKNISEVTRIRSIVLHPVPSAWLVTFLLTFIFYDTLPDIVAFLNMILILIPVVIILLNILPENTRRYVLIPAVASFMVQLHSMGYSENTASRLFLIGIIIFTLISIITIVRRRIFRDHTLNPVAGRKLYYLALIAITLLSISLISAIIGGTMLAEFLTYATVKSAALMLMLYAAGITLNSILFTLLYSSQGQKINMVAHYHKLIFTKGSKLFTALTWLVWGILSLDFFRIWDNVFGFIKRVFSYSITIGKVDLSLTNLVVFILVIWITIQVSRLVKVVIEGEVAPRVKMKRGVPGALSLVTRILVITVGFLFAIAAAGVELDRLALLLGALGVGIGFGLQNIFNNLISGIILAFERPIQEGDVIEVGGLWGTVKEIGIRASSIITIDGAEVIVPNGNLISNELTNWTLTNRIRRLEVSVGVKYGTDPDKVIQVLQKVADEADEALNEPKPLILFKGFGESSLDFGVMFWIDDADKRFELQSRMTVKVNNALTEAGIEIPFPQRDLHLRTVAEEVIKKAKK